MTLTPMEICAGAALADDAPGKIASAQAQIRSINDAAEIVWLVWARKCMIIVDPPGGWLAPQPQKKCWRLYFVGLTKDRQAS